MTSVLCCRAITKRFGMSAPAVDEVTFELNEGELLGLLGPSGCGKTTLLRLVAGFERADAGEILLDGRPVSLRDGGAVSPCAFRWAAAAGGAGAGVGTQAAVDFIG